VGLEPVYATVSLTGQTAAIGSSTLCSRTSCGQGQFVVTYYLNSTVTCATPGPAQVSLNIGWTDDAGTKMFSNVALAGTGSTANSMALGNTGSTGNFCEWADQFLVGWGEPNYISDELHGMHFGNGNVFATDRGEADAIEESHVASVCGIPP